MRKKLQFKMKELHFGLCGDWAEYYGATVFFEHGWFVYGKHFGVLGGRGGLGSRKQRNRRSSR